MGKVLNLLVTTLPHPPPDLPLEGGGEGGASLCAWISLEGEGESFYAIALIRGIPPVSADPFCGKMRTRLGFNDDNPYSSI